MVGRCLSQRIKGQIFTFIFSRLDFNSYWIRFANQSHFRDLLQSTTAEYHDPPSSFSFHERKSTCIIQGLIHPQLTVYLCD